MVIIRNGRIHPYHGSYYRPDRRVLSEHQLRRFVESQVQNRTSTPALRTKTLLLTGLPQQGCGALALRDEINVELRMLPCRTYRTEFVASLQVIPEQKAAVVVVAPGYIVHIADNQKKLRLFQTYVRVALVSPALEGLGTSWAAHLEPDVCAFRCIESNLVSFLMISSIGSGHLMRTLSPMVVVYSWKYRCCRRRFGLL